MHSLHRFLDETIEMALICETLRQGKEAPPFKESLQKVIAELESWGLHHQQRFAKNVPAQSLCVNILDTRDPSGGLTRSMLDVFGTLHDEYENLRKLLEGKEADLEQARDFCLLLNEVGLSQSSRRRRFLAA
jgi:hypothetical protein